jgi:hypothetical protein
VATGSISSPLQAAGFAILTGNLTGLCVALYIRVSTGEQTVDNQVHALQQIAERRGWEIVASCTDAGVSGAKGRDKRLGLD